MLKLIIDFESKEALDIVNYFFELNKNEKQDVEIHGIDLKKDKKLNQAYYGLYYANKFGVGLEFTKRILDAYHLENQDINKLATLASLYKEIGCNPNDMIDALMEGDYPEMHEFIQFQYMKDKLDSPCSVYSYNDLGEKDEVICGCKNIIEYLK